MIFCWILLLFSASIRVQASCNINTVDSSWGKKSWGKFEFTVPASTTTGLYAKKEIFLKGFLQYSSIYNFFFILGWTIEVTFDKPVKKLKVWNGKNISCSGTVCTFSNKNWNKVQNQGSMLSLGYEVKFQKKPVGNLVGLKFNEIDVCSSTDTTTTAATTTTTTTTTTPKPKKAFGGFTIKSNDFGNSEVFQLPWCKVAKQAKCPNSGETCCKNKITKVEIVPENTKCGDNRKNFQCTAVQVNILLFEGKYIFLSQCIDTLQK